MKTYTPQDLFEAVNHAQPSLIRLEADELTYLLHIIIRYELEKDLISGALDVDDLPDAWSSKYEEYLSIRPCCRIFTGLQDMLDFFRLILWQMLRLHRWQQSWHRKSEISIS